MYQNEFDPIIRRQLDRCEDLLAIRGNEYATTDRLHNFRVAASMQDTTMRSALAGMMAKHTASIYDMINDEIDAHNKEKWDEKITDHINYLLILQAVLYDERSKTTPALYDTLPFENEKDN